MTLDNVASYTVTYAWSAATTVTSAVSGDLLLVSRSGTVYDMDVDTLVTYALTGIQATVLNLSGLGTATLADSDLLAICQTTTAKKATIASLETLLWADFKTYVTGLTDIATVADSDELYAIQSGVAKAVTMDDIAVYMSAEIITIGDVQTSSNAALAAYLTALTETTDPQAADVLYVLQGGTAYKITMATVAQYAMDATFELPWKLIAASKYTALPTSTSTLDMSDTSDLSIGDPVKFTWSGVTYYAVISAMLANTQITISGAPFNAAVSLSALYVGTPTQMKSITYWISDLFGDAVYDILAYNGRYERWEGPPAYLVSFAATAGIVDTGAAQPKINVKIATNAVSTDDSNKGLQVSGVAGTWVANTNIQIDADYYDIARGNAIEICCTEAGTNGDAADLSITLTFVYE